MIRQSKQRMTKAYLCVFPVLFGLTATGCGHFKRPSTVVHSVYLDCNNGEYPKARHLFVQDLREMTDGALEANGKGGIKSVCDHLTNSSSLTSVDIVSETIEGDRATVIVDAHFVSGETHYGERSTLVRENGVWKLTPP
jgi:hypothetical protein